MQEPATDSNSDLSEEAAHGRSKEPLTGPSKESDDERLPHVPQDLVLEELKKHGLSDVEWKSDQGEEKTIDVDYFMRLINYSVLIAEKIQESYLKEGLARRRKAHSECKWSLYADIVNEMSLK